jgi:hypothetical protein
MHPSKLIAQAIGINSTNPGFGTIQNLRPSQFLTTIINFFLGLAGVISFIFLLWGGIQWVMSGGDKEALDKSRKKISAALIGLSLVFSAYALIFIIRVLFGVSLIQFDIRTIGTAGGGGGGNPLCVPCSGPGYCGVTGNVYSYNGNCRTCLANGWGSPFPGTCDTSVCTTCP